MSDQPREPRPLGWLFNQKPPPQTGPKQAVRRSQAVVLNDATFLVVQIRLDGHQASWMHARPAEPERAAAAAGLRRLAEDIERGWPE